MGPAQRLVVTDSGKRVLKRGLQLIVSTFAKPVWWFPDQSLVVLMYHRVLPEGHPDRATMQPGMVVGARTFELHLTLLKEHFTLVHLAEWLRRARTGRPLPARACALTFDDGWSDMWETVYPLLRREGVPATLFLVSDYVGTTRRFWPERLVDILGRAREWTDAWSRPEFEWLRGLGMGPGLASDTVIDAAKHFTDDAIEERLAGMEERLGVAPRARAPHLLSWDQARRMVDERLVEVGSHTCTHCRLGRGFRESQARREIEASRHTLRERLDRPIELFCYPNGEISPAAERLVRANYAGACSTSRGWNEAGDDLHRVRRIGMHDGVSSDRHAFLSRLSGWL